MQRPVRKKPQTRIQKQNISAILDAALEVFSAHGFRGSTLDQIANEAGLSKPNVLYYFNGKEEIYMEANQVKAIDTTGAGDAFNFSRESSRWKMAPKRFLENTIHAIQRLRPDS